MERIAIIALESVRLASLGIVGDAFALCDGFRERLYGNQVTYPSDQEVGGLKVRVLTLTGEAIQAAGGVRVSADGRATAEEAPACIYVPAFGRNVPEDTLAQHDRWGDMLAWLRFQHAAGVPVAASGAGVFVLAEAGLLDGRQAVVPWQLEARLAADYPAVRLLRGMELSQSADVLLAASARAEAGLALALIRLISSPNSAHWLASTIGMDSQEAADSTSSGDPAVCDPLALRFRSLARGRFADRTDVAGFARLLGVSERTLRRRVVAATGQSPADWLRILRLDAGSMLLVRGTLPVDQIASLVGYDDATTFRNAFRKRFHSTPSQFRRGR